MYSPILLSSSTPCSLAGWGPRHLVASSTFNSLPLSSAMVFHSWPFVPALSRSRLTQSFHHSFGLPLLLLPPSSAFQALFDSLSSLILGTCPARLILLLATFIFRCFLMLISSLNSFIFLLSSWVTLHILWTQLFSAICIFSSCLSVSASVPHPYIQAGTTQASNSFTFSCFFIFLSHIMPSTLLHAAAPASTLLCIVLLLPPSSHTVQPKYANIFSTPLLVLKGNIQR